ncbi:MAG: DUF1700 domain-containing protein [Oscillospiraceae bacterium]|nr:DUF1700 domain-containing protein [Oscillospiraceae bacterium]
MNKKEFLQKLRDDLTSLTEEERISALKYYDEYFSEAEEEKDNEIITELKSPEELADRIEEELAEITEHHGGIVLTLEPDAADEKRENIFNFDAPAAPGTPESVIEIEIKKEERQYNNTNNKPESNKKNKSTVFLIVLFCTFPVWLPVLIGIASAGFGVFMCLIGVSFAVAVVALCGFVMVGAGFLSVGFGVFNLFFNTAGALYPLGAGLIIIGIGIITAYLFTKLTAFMFKTQFKFAGWTVRKIRSAL